MPDVATLAMEPCRAPQRCPQTVTGAGGTCAPCFARWLLVKFPIPDHTGTSPSTAGVRNRAPAAACGAGDLPHLVEED